MTTTKIFKIAIGVYFHEDNEERIAKKEFFLIEEKKEHTVECTNATMIKIG